MNNIAKIRGKFGLTQTELGEKLGVCKACISLQERSVISGKTAERIAEALGVNVFEVYGEDVLKILPKTPEEKASLLEIVNNL